MSKDKMTRLTINLPVSLRQRIREAAAKQDMDMSAFMHMLIHAYFNKEEKKGK
jgi:predicted DNA binding CopG/RHH family protein